MSQIFSTAARCVVGSGRGGVLTLSEACERYSLTAEADSCGYLDCDWSPIWHLRVRLLALFGTKVVGRKRPESLRPQWVESGH